MRLLLIALVALAVAAPALASERHPTQSELEGEVMCPTCHTTLDMSSAPVAQRIKAFIALRIRAGDSKGEIKRRLVADFGPAILAEPSKSGFGLLAWLLPLGGIVFAGAAVGLGAWQWSRKREAPEAAEPGLDAESERRLDDALARFDA